VYPRVGFLGRFGGMGSGLATGSLQISHAAARTSPRKKLEGFSATSSNSSFLHFCRVYAAINQFPYVMGNRFSGTFLFCKPLVLIRAKMDSYTVHIK